MEYLFRQVVFAVGQGGFSMGSLYDQAGTSRLYSYVYDCGSDQLSALRRELQAAGTHFLDKRDRKIETVFISHLDADHVNGFDMLCEMVDRQIGEVILPYLDFESRYYLVAQAMSQGIVSGMLLEFYINPVKWVRNRLPDATITLLGSPSGNDLLDPPQFPFDPDRKEMPDENNHSAGKLVIITKKDNGFSTAEKGIQQHRWVAVQPSDSRATEPPVALLAYIPPRADAQLRAFRMQLTTNGFGRLSKAGLQEVLADRGQRERLRNCYLELASDHNIVSIHLLVKFPRHVEFLEPYSYRYLWEENAGEDFAFAFSGDAKLNVPKYYDHWEQFFGEHLKKVVLFSLPHHGSKLNFNTRFFQSLPLAGFIAQSGPNSYGHPGTEVTEQIEAFNREFHHVSEEAGSRIYIKVRIT